MVNLTKFELFLIWCAGHDATTLRQCTRSEVTKICIMGSLVLIPTLLGFLSVGCAAYLTSKSILAALSGGTVWATIIFIMERAIVGYGRGKKINLVFVGRALLAATSAFGISMFLEIAIFWDAIREQQLLERVEMNDGIKDKYDDQTASLQIELADAKERLDAKEQAYLIEMDGTGGSHKRGCGSICQEKRAAYQKDSIAFNELRDTIAAKIAQIETAKRDELSRANGAYAEGILGSLRALFAIEDPIVKYAAWILRILLLLLELTPIFIKVSPTGDIELYFSIKDSNDENRLAIQKRTNKDQLNVLESEAKLHFQLRLMELHAEEVKSILQAQTANTKVLMQQLVLFAKMHRETAKQIVATVPNAAEQQVLLQQLQAMYDSLIATVHSLTQQSNGFYISRMAKT